MNKDSLDKMKALIEAKKQKGKNTKNSKKASKSIGNYAKGLKKSNNGGGLFDK